MTTVFSSDRKIDAKVGLELGADHRVERHPGARRAGSPWGRASERASGSRAAAGRPRAGRESGRDRRSGTASARRARRAGRRSERCSQPRYRAIRIDVVAGGRVREQAAVLDDVTQPVGALAAPSRGVSSVPAIETEPVSGCDQADHQPQQRRLAAAARPDQDRRPARRDREVELGRARPTRRRTSKRLSARSFSRCPVATMGRDQSGASVWGG